MCLTLPAAVPPPTVQSMAGGPEEIPAAGMAPASFESSRFRVTAPRPGSPMSCMVPSVPAAGTSDPL